MVVTRGEYMLNLVVDIAMFFSFNQSCLLAPPHIIKKMVCLDSVLQYSRTKKKLTFSPRDAC